MNVLQTEVSFTTSSTAHLAGVLPKNTVPDEALLSVVILTLALQTRVDPGYCLSFEAAGDELSCTIHWDSTLQLRLTSNRTKKFIRPLLTTTSPQGRLTNQLNSSRQNELLIRTYKAFQPKWAESANQLSRLGRSLKCTWTKVGTWRNNVHGEAVKQITEVKKRDVAEITHYQYSYAPMFSFGLIIFGLKCSK